MKRTATKRSGANREAQKAPSHSLHEMVGRIGEFTTGRGDVCQCLVTGLDEPPWDDLSLVIDYVTVDGLKITGAMIPAAAFRPDSPNGELINCREVVEALRLQCEGICVMKQEEITVTNFEALDSPKVTLPNEPQQP